MNPTTRGTNAKTHFSVREHLQQFNVNGVALLLHGFECPCDFEPPLKQLVGVSICQAWKWFRAFRR
jgi:hypothetical protein